MPSLVRRCWVELVVPHTCLRPLPIFRLLLLSAARAMQLASELDIHDLCEIFYLDQIPGKIGAPAEQLMRTELERFAAAFKSKNCAHANSTTRGVEKSEQEKERFDRLDPANLLHAAYEACLWDPKDTLTRREVLLTLAGEMRIGKEIQGNLNALCAESSSLVCAQCCIAPTAPQKLFQCDACRRACYCSRSCQRKHWKAGHREACKTMIFDVPTLVANELKLTKGEPADSFSNQVRAVEAFRVLSEEYASFTNA